MRSIFQFLLLAVLIGCSTPVHQAPPKTTLSQWTLGASKQYVLVESVQSSLPVIVFVHGGPGNPLTPYAHRIDPSFLKYFNVVHWDQRASGLSFAKTKNDHLTIDQYARDLKELLQQVRAKFRSNKVVLLGSSWGSLVGLEVAYMHPKLLDYYIGVGQMIHPLQALNQTYISLKNSGHLKIENLGPPPWDPKQFFSFVNVAARSYQYPKKLSHAEMIQIAEASPYYRSVGTSVIEEGQFHSITRLNDEINAFNAFDGIKTLNVPHLFIQGHHDWITPTGLVNEFVKLRGAGPTAQVVELREYGHDLLLECPDVVAQTAAGFVAGFN